MSPRCNNGVTMPTDRLSMRKIRDVLRLKFEAGLSERAIARSQSLSNGAENGYLQRARVAGLGWPLPDNLDDTALEQLLFPPAPSVAGPARPVPNWPWVEKELRRRGVILALLWEEYRAAHPDGFGYSWFCEHYATFKKCMRPTLRQTHVAGEKVFVDFAGDMIDGRSRDRRSTADEALRRRHGRVKLRMQAWPFWAACRSSSSATI